MMLLFILFIFLDIFSNTLSYNKIKWLLVVISMFLVAGIVFKILHWKYADMLLFGSYVFCVLFYLIYAFIPNKNKAENYAKSAFMIVLGAASIFRVFHWIYAFELSLIALVLILIYLGLVAIRYFNDRDKSSIPPGDTGSNF